MRKAGIAVSFLAIAALLTATPGLAADTKYRISADYINWTANRGEMDFVYPDNGSVVFVDPDSDGGFRFAFEIMQGPATYRIGYTNYEVDEEADDRGGGQGTLVIDDVCAICQSFNFAMGTYDSDYSVIDLGVAYQLRPDSDFGLELLTGVVLASLEEEFTAVYSDDPTLTQDTDRASMENEVEAFGFNIGLRPSYRFHEMVSIFSRLNYAPMMADVDRSFRYGAGFGSLTTEFDVEMDETEIIHNVELSAGVEVMPVEWLTLAVGYESATWLNYPSYLKLTSESGEETIDRGGEGLGFSGGFFRAGFSF